jgi:hypothetical protein
MVAAVYDFKSPPKDPSQDVNSILDQCKQVGALYVAILLGIQSFQTFEDAITTLAGSIKENAALQTELNVKNAAVKFSILPENANDNDIKRVGDENMEFTAIRENIESELITARQDGQLEMSTVQMKVSDYNQHASLITKLLDSLKQLAELINKLSDPQ